MLLHDRIRGKLTTPALEAVAEYFERIARDIRSSAAIQSNREQISAEQQAGLVRAFQSSPLIEQLVAAGTPDEIAIAAIAGALHLPAFQIGAIWHRYKISRRRARKLERDAKAVQLVERGWSNAAIARELERLGYRCHPATVTRIWKRHVARSKIGPLAAPLPTPRSL